MYQLGHQFSCINCIQSCIYLQTNTDKHSGSTTWLSMIQKERKNNTFKINDNRFSLSLTSNHRDCTTFKSPLDSRLVYYDQKRSLLHWRRCGYWECSGGSSIVHRRNRAHLCSSNSHMEPTSRSLRAVVRWNLEGSLRMRKGKWQ